MEWHDLAHLGYPGYSVSDMGDIRNDYTGRILKPSYSQAGVLKVGMMNRDENVQEVHGVASLVALCFLPGGEPGDCVINKDGNRANNDVDNLAWRPNWFAKRYHRQFRMVSPLIVTRLLCVDTEEIFENSADAAKHFGLLERDILRSVSSGMPVFPIMYRFVLFDVE